MATAENTTEVRSISNALEQLFDISALVECVEASMEEDIGISNPALRVLHIAQERIKTVTDYLDAIDAQNVKGASA